MGRLLLAAGVFLAVAGLAVMGLDRLGLHLGRLPGDIRIEGKNADFYFPVVTSVVTCILISAVVSLIGWLFRPR